MALWAVLVDYQVPQLVMEDRIVKREVEVFQDIPVPQVYEHLKQKEYQTLSASTKSHDVPAIDSSS
eukprot:1304829-Amphidinium_carterae.1